MEAGSLDNTDPVGTGGPHSVFKRQQTADRLRAQRHQSTRVLVPQSFWEGEWSVVRHLFWSICSSDYSSSVTWMWMILVGEHLPPLLLWYTATLPLASPAKRKDSECLRQSTGQLSGFTMVSRHWTAVFMLLYTWMLGKQGDELLRSRTAHLMKEDLKESFILCLSWSQALSVLQTKLVYVSIKNRRETTTPLKFTK